MINSNQQQKRKKRKTKPIRLNWPLDDQSTLWLGHEHIVHKNWTRRRGERGSSSSMQVRIVPRKLLPPAHLLALQNPGFEWLTSKCLLRLLRFIKDVSAKAFHFRVDWIFAFLMRMQRKPDSMSVWWSISLCRLVSVIKNESMINLYLHWNRIVYLD